MNWKQAWNNSRTYLPGVVAYLSGQAYRCNVVNTGETPPSAKWTALKLWQDNIQRFTAGMNIAAGQPVSPKLDGTIEVSSGTSSIPVGISNQDMAASDQGAVVICGYITIPSWSFIPNKPVFVESTGALTQTVPTDIIKEIGVAVSTNAMIVNPQKPISLI